VSVGNGGYRVNLFENSGDEVKVENLLGWNIRKSNMTMTLNQ
jgi:hypothetical protein